MTLSRVNIIRNAPVTNVLNVSVAPVVKARFCLRSNSQACHSARSPVEWAWWGHLMTILFRLIAGLRRVVLPACLLAGCASQSGELAHGGGAPPRQADNPKSAYAMPPNYRQLVARRLAETVDPGTLTRAEISRPEEGWMGLVNGGVRPYVCVTGAPAGGGEHPAWLVLFENGRVSDMERAMRVGCLGQPWTPFPEFQNRRS